MKEKRFVELLLTAFFILITAGLLFSLTPTGQERIDDTGLLVRIAVLDCVALAGILYIRWNRRSEGSD